MINGLASHTNGLRELSLFSGAGGGLLATQHLLGHRTVCYVENDAYCVEVLKSRIRDGLLDDAPIWDDVRTFDGRPWRGCVDLVTAGFPCQPFSTASHGHKTTSNLWNEAVRIVEECRPQHVFAENVSRGAIRAASVSLRALDYDTALLSLPASYMGADHVRNRYWLRAYANDQGELLRGYDAEMGVVSELQAGIWQTQPFGRRMADGVARRMDRYRATGNGQVPRVAAAAWRLLSQ